MKVSAIIFIAIFGVACQAASIQKEDQAEGQLTNLYEIDVDTAPSDGTIRGLRIRRSGNGFGYPEIDIEKESDGSFSVNGIRVKRGDLKDLDDVDLDEEASEDEAAADRTRRSGDLLGILGHKLHEKLSLIAGSSSGHHAEHDHHGHYGTPHSYDAKSFDIWAFKKAILSTLLQAAKAIKGGVIALGGQLVKAKGHLISAGGKVVAHKGEEITEYGKSVAAKALLHHGDHHHEHHHDHHEHSEHGSSFSSGEHETHGYTSGGSSFVAPTVGYSTASFGAGSHGYTKRGAYAVPQEVPKDVHAGLLVLKPINVPDEGSYGKRKGSPFAQARDASVAQSQIQPDTRPAQDRSFYVY